MTATAELNQDESFMESIGPPSSDDLFGGDILGDELMDIYNAAVVGGGNDDEVMNEIPSLLGPSDLSSEKKDGTLDDGFGAFRPSTSFNNLSIMLQEPSSEPNAVQIAPSVQPPADNAVSATRVVSSASLSPGLMISPTPTVSSAPFVTTPGGTKRKATTAGGQSPKRKSTGGVIKSKQQKNTTKKASKKKSPEPLTQSRKSHSTTTTAANAARMTAHSKVKKAEPVSTATPSTVVPLASNIQPIKQETAAPSVSAVTSTVSKMKAPQVTSSSAPVAAPALSVLSNPPTEADFKSVAQAAVNNLIMNAGAATKATSAKTKGRSNSMPSPTSSSKTTSITTVKRVDTSTEHVKALTGSNWVAVCGGIGTTGDSNNNQNNSEKMCNRARRSNLTPDERARQNRDRNREHARNTRLRKKAYVEELKATLSALVSQRDAAELEKRHTSQRELEQREVRFRVLEEFLKLRGRNEANAVRWAAILEEKFTLTLPMVNFREMVHSNDNSHRNANALHEQVLTGVTEAMNDSNLCASFLQTLGKQGNSEIITLAYNCDRHNFFMDNCIAVLDWTATTHGASEQGIELIVKGHTRAKFCPASNKLISVVMSFDTGVIISQINLINKVKASSEAEAAAAAAQVAANEADALLDSLQMPHFEPPSVGPPQSRPLSSNNEDKAVISSDDDNHNNYSKDEAEDEQMLL